MQLFEARRCNKVSAEPTFVRPSNEVQFYPAEGQHSGTPSRRLTNSTPNPMHVAIFWAVSFDLSKVDFVAYRSFQNFNIYFLRAIRPVLFLETINQRSWLGVEASDIILNWKEL